MKNFRATSVAARFAILALLGSAGCRLSPWTGKAAISVPGGPTATQSGDAAIGANVTKSETLTTLPIPSGSRVEVPAPTPKESAVPVNPAATVTLAAPTTLSTRTVTQSATAPTTHEPPKPPTPADVATGAGIRAFYWVAAAFAVGALFCFYAGHVKAGVICAVGAGALPLLASFSTFAASHLAVLLGAGAIALVLAWYLVKGKLASLSEVIKTNTSQ